MSREKVLVVDDDRSIRTYLSEFLSRCGYEVDSLESGDEAVERLAGGSMPDVVLLDVVIPGMGGLEVLARAKALSPSLPVIMLSGMGQIKTVVEAMKKGASDYLTKPFEEQELELAIENVLEKQQLRDEVKSLRRRLDQCAEHADILSSNPKVMRIKEIALHVADVDVPVLILGESGVGKEVVARFIHAQSKRSDKPFIKVNCAALPHDLLESELFGHERGAFTGAHCEKPGLFEMANTGSILLDEIGEMSTQLQAKLLHVLQDGEYSRLGGKRTVKIDARILATTNRRLEETVAKGEFREDLYFRLNVIKVELPPLRARPEDIPLLCNYFVQKYRDRYGSPVCQLPADLLEAFLGYEWPGNVRQLENVIKRFLILGDLDMVLSELRGNCFRLEPILQEGLALKEVAAQAAGQAERDAVMRALDETNWNRKKAAAKLGICYKALLNKLKKWQIDNRTRNVPTAAIPLNPRAPGREKTSAIN